MGIQGLLPFLKDASTQVNVKMLAGYTVAVDAYCWIYRGAFACAMDLARGDKSDMYVKFVLKYVNMLLSHGIKPVIVFDGCNLPSKQGVEDSRRERKQLYLQKGKQFLRDGNTAQARECFQKCINVTPQMAHEVMEACRTLGVDCIVAPYEADAQLAYLNKCGIAQAVITEDSDLLAFGCDRVIFKLDLNGNGTMIEKHRLSQCLKIKAQNFTFDKFRSDKKEPSRSVDVDTINDEKEEDLSLEPTEPSWRKELQSFQRQGKIGSQNDKNAKTEKRKRVLSEEDGEEETSSPQNEPNVDTSEASNDSSLVNALPKLSEELFSEVPHKETPKNPFKVATPKQGSAFSWTRSTEKQITLKSSVSSLGRFKYSTLSQAKRKKTSQEEVNSTISSQEEVNSTTSSQEEVDITGNSKKEVKNSTSSQESIGELREEESLSKSPVGNSSLKPSHVGQSMGSFDNCSVYSMDTFTPTNSQNSGSASFSQGSQYFTASEGNSTQVSTTEMSQTSGDTTKEEVTEIKEESQQPVCSQSLEDGRYSEENDIKTFMRLKESARSHDVVEQVSSYFEKSALPSLSQTALDQRAVVQDMGRRAMEDGMGTPRMGKPSRGKVRQVGLSRRSCPSQTKRKRNNENNSTQPKISNFLQQFSLKKGPSQTKKEEPIRKPMSPSKANVVIDCTPETEPSIAVSLNGAKVKRNIFDNE
uniref:Exonuclease 1 n=1 Tax=Branchiostoma floridae TaxID=7739 RepID=C3Z4R4_BRAFL|eukprot:XP_002596491.1 hypothetical protein BRAFLDRAFT_130306 [Branchiostoma floridae]